MKKYSLVSYLVGKEFEKVRELQRELSKLTGSTKCLTDWQPHITVGDGPELSEKQLHEYENKLQKFILGHQPLTAKISGFGGIDHWKGAIENEITPYVIWLNVEVTPELQQLWEDLRGITEQYSTWLPRTENYVPHITLAFADLTKEGYEKGMKYHGREFFESSFRISHVALAECYGIGNMTSKEYKRFEFKNT